MNSDLTLRAQQQRYQLRHTYRVITRFYREKACQAESTLCRYNQAINAVLLALMNFHFVKTGRRSYRGAPVVSSKENRLSNCFLL